MGPRSSHSQSSGWVGGGRLALVLLGCGTGFRPTENVRGFAAPGHENPTTRSTASDTSHTVTFDLAYPSPSPDSSVRSAPRPLVLRRPPRPAAATRPASVAMTTSRRLADRKIARFEKNITKRGAVPETVKKGNDYPVGPILLGFFVFVVVGSSLFQIIRTATSAGLF
ncbi:uncharacterized protein LOC133893051 [Phragmites australis]|uniref:uncharacterized protein LOC133893051 n=1 Tax=Phragmites australis TaxID=29695 RepID=UPI002D76F5D9|nr:uncharacterized protein LOC133893051 [Phragmites australis]